MPSPIHTKQLPAYYKEDGLVFQFLLSDWLLASKSNFELSSQIYKLLEKPTSTRTFQDLDEHLKKLYGIHHHTIRFLAPEDGLLKKLSHFAAVLARDIVDEKADERLLRKSTNQAWGFAMELEHLLVNIKESSKDTLPSKLAHLKEQGEKITAELKKMGKIIPKIFTKFQKDENVLFFFIRHKNDFDNLHSKGFVKKMIVKAYPKGLSEAESFLMQRYTKRGFHELVAMIKMHMQDLKK